MSAPTATDATTAAPARELRWVALGDSFTAGVDDCEVTWASLVRAQVSEVAPTALLNLAEAGAMISAIERDQFPIAIGTAPDVLTLICGGNEIIRNVRPRTEQLTIDLDRAFGTLARALPRTTLLTATYPPIFNGALRPRTRARIDRGFETLNELIRGSAMRHGFECAELAGHPGHVEASNYAADGVHPSAAGHRAAAAVLGARMTEVITANSQESP